MIYYAKYQRSHNINKEGTLISWITDDNFLPSCWYNL